MRAKRMGNKKEQVYQQLRGQIINCELQPGLPINEAVFAEKLGVSKTPVREAIRQLEREGLVSSISGRGSIISFISSTDIYEIFEIREIIECGAAQQAAGLLHKEELLRKKEELLRMKNEIGENIQDQNWDFCDDIHFEIIRLVGNRKLLKMYREVLDTIERIRNNFGHRFTERRREDIIDEHIALLDAVLSGDGGLAQEKVRRHLNNGYTYVKSLT